MIMRFIGMPLTWCLQFKKIKREEPSEGFLSFCSFSLPQLYLWQLEGWRQLHFRHHLRLLCFWQLEMGDLSFLPFLKILLPEQGGLVFKWAVTCIYMDEKQNAFEEKMNTCLCIFVYVTYLAIETAVPMQRWVTEDPSTGFTCMFCICL